MRGTHGRRMNACGKCPDGTIQIDGETGESFCQICGHVVADCAEYNRGPGRQSGNARGTDMALAITPETLLLHDMGLSTVIGSENRDGAGNAISGEARKNTERLRYTDKRAPSTRLKPAYMAAFAEIDRTRKALGIGGAVAEKAAYIYRKVYEKRLITYNHTQTLAVAALYTACREMQSRRTLRDVAVASGVSAKTVGLYYRRICAKLDLRIPPVEPSVFISRIASNAGLSERTKMDALDIMQKAEERRIAAGKNPLVMAAATLYVAAGLNGETRGLCSMAKASGVTMVSIRGRARDCRLMLGYPVSPGPRDAVEVESREARDRQPGVKRAKA